LGHYHPLSQLSTFSIRYSASEKAVQIGRIPHPIRSSSFPKNRDQASLEQADRDFADFLKDFDKKVMYIAVFK